MLASGEEARLMKDVLKDLKVQLSVQKVDWIKEVQYDDIDFDFVTETLLILI